MVSDKNHSIILKMFILWTRNQRNNGAKKVNPPHRHIRQCLLSTLLSYKAGHHQLELDMAVRFCALCHSFT